MTLILMLVQCLLFIIYITGVVYWYSALKKDVQHDINVLDEGGIPYDKYILLLVVSCLWPVLVCYSAIKKLKIKVDK